MAKLSTITDGKHIARRDGFDTYRSWTQSMARRFLLVYTGRLDEAAAHAQARVDFGRWCAFCPNCGGSEYVDVDDPVFYCLSCGNEQAGGALIPLDIPAQRQAIEQLLLERDVQPGQGRYEGAIAMTSRPLIKGLGRDWNGEPVAVLAQKNKARGLPGRVPKGKADKLAAGGGA